MTVTEIESWIQGAFQKLIARGVIKADEISPSTVTDADIAAYEAKYDVKLPVFYRSFLKTCSFHFEQIAAPLPEDIYAESLRAPEEEYFHTLWLQIVSIPKDLSRGKSFDNPLEKLGLAMDGFRENIEWEPELLGVTLEEMRHFLPIGDWGAGWGTLCIDLEKADEDVRVDDESTWNLVWFDHEDFPWKNPNTGELRARKAAPDFKTLLEWYFCGAFDLYYEKQLEEDGEEPLDYSSLVRR